MNHAKPKKSIPFDYKEEFDGSICDWSDSPVETATAGQELLSNAKIHSTCPTLKDKTLSVPVLPVRAVQSEIIDELAEEEQEEVPFSSFGPIDPSLLFKPGRIIANLLQYHQNTLEYLALTMSLKKWETFVLRQHQLTSLKLFTKLSHGELDTLVLRKRENK